MAWLPAASAAVVNVATPPVSVTVPSVVVPSLKATVPAGVPPADVTVAVNVTGCPKVDGFVEDATSVLVAAGSTTWERSVDVFAEKLSSPP
jgi:hypothetical protein